MKKKTDKKIEKRETFEQLHEKSVKSMTRRELLSAGLIQFTATMTVPSIVSLLANNNVAYAQEAICSQGGDPALVPIVVINLAGGAGLASNFVPQGIGGLTGQLDPLGSYSKLGLGKTPGIVQTFSNNAPFHTNGGAGGTQSSILTGIQTEGATAMANTAFVGVCVRTRDDSAGNPYNIEGMVEKAGRNGFLLPNLGRNRNMHAIISPPTPINVTGFNDITGALGVTGRLAANLNPGQQNKLFQIIKNLSGSQVRNLASASGSTEMGKLIQCATGANADVVGADTSNLNPTSNADFATVWGINNNTSTRSRDFVSASIVFNVLNNKTGVANINLGGYDYHNGTRTTGDQRDLEAGEMIGKVLSSFQVLNKKAFLIVTTDGAVTGPDSQAGGIWTSDRGGGGALYMMAYDPAGPPMSNSFQLGYFNEGQSAEESFITGGNPERALAGIFANYLAFCNRLSLVQSVIPRFFTSTDLDKIIKIGNRSS